MKKSIDLATLKVLMISGRLTPEALTAIIEGSEPDNRVNLLKSPIGIYLEEISNEPNIFEMVEKVCKISNIKFFGISQKNFFSVLKAIRIQTEVIAKIINDIQYPELTDIQKEAGYGSKHFGTAGLICNLAESFHLSYLDAEKQPVISLTKLRMNAHLATCQANEEKIKKMFQKS